jgi:hypothetical protein
MIDDLKGFESAPPMGPWIVGGLLALMAVMSFVIVYLDRPAEPAPTQTVQAPDSAAPLTHPLGCPVEDARGRPLKATLSIQGERKPRCYYVANPK